MSFNALAWAAKVDPGSMAGKMVLFALANYADAEGCAYPSIAAIAEFGSMNRKTVISVLTKLEADGFVHDTGGRVGSTGQVKVYRLAVNSPENGMLETVPKTGRLKRKESQKRDRLKSPVFTRKESQKRDTDTIREPIPLTIPSGMVSPSLFLPIEEIAEPQAPDAPDAPAPLTPDEVVEAWNVTATRHGLPTVKALTGERRRRLGVRIREHSVENFTAAIAAIGRSPFLCGENDRGWRADFDFFIQPKTIPKLIEGSYDRA